MSLHDPCPSPPSQSSLSLTLTHINSHLASHFLRDGHFEEHGVAAVLNAQVLITGLYVSLLPHRYFPSHDLLMGFTLVQQSLLQHIVSELQFLYLTSRLEKLVLVSSQDFLHFAIRIELVRTLFIFFLADALEGFAHFQVETFEELDVVLSLGAQKIVLFFEILDLLQISLDLLLCYYSSRLIVPFYLRKVASYFLKVAFCLLKSQIYFIYSVTNGPNVQYTCRDVMASLLDGGGVGSSMEKSSSLMSCERLGSKSDGLEKKLLSLSTHLLSPQDLKSSMAADIFLILVISRLTSLTLDLSSFSFPAFLLLRDLSFYSCLLSD